MFLDNNQLISPIQHGFRKGLSCLTALVKITNLLFIAKRDKLHSILVTIDFKRAFDSLCHPMLINALQEHGFSENARMWFSSYLSDRTQQVKYSGAQSDRLSILSGVPQGSILGPTLFNIYINTLLRQLSTENAVAYADDLTLITSSKSRQAAQDKMQYLLNQITTWAASHHLTINTDKCFILPISPAARPKFIAGSPTLVINGTLLPVVDNVKILGLTLSHDLNWSNHIQKTKTKVSRMIGTLNRFGRTFTHKIRRQVYTSFIKPQSNYCRPIWGNTKISAQNMLISMRCVAS
jgi:hypothetical protein